MFRDVEPSTSSKSTLPFRSPNRGRQKSRPFWTSNRASTRSSTIPSSESKSTQITIIPRLESSRSMRITTIPLMELSPRTGNMRAESERMAWTSSGDSLAATGSRATLAVAIATNRYRIALTPSLTLQRSTPAGLARYFRSSVCCEAESELWL